MNEIVVAGSHPVLPRVSQSQGVIRKYADMLTGGRTTDMLRFAEREVGIGHVAAFADSFALISQGAGAGGFFGFLAKHGMIEWDGAPVDAWAAGVTGAIGVFLARFAIGQTVRNFAGNATAVYAFRKISGWKASASSLAAHGEDADLNAGADPIVEAARNL